MLETNTRDTLPDGGFHGKLGYPLFFPQHISQVTTSWGNDEPVMHVCSFTLPSPAFLSARTSLRTHLWMASYKSNIVGERAGAQTALAFKYGDIERKHIHGSSSLSLLGQSGKQKPAIEQTIWSANPSLAAYYRLEMGHSREDQGSLSSRGGCSNYISG